MFEIHQDYLLWFTPCLNISLIKIIKPEVCWVVYFLIPVTIMRTTLLSTRDMYVSFEMWLQCNNLLSHRRDCLSSRGLIHNTVHHQPLICQLNSYLFLIPHFWLVYDCQMIFFSFPFLIDTSIFFFLWKLKFQLLPQNYEWINS